MINFKNIQIKSNTTETLLSSCAWVS